MISDQRRHTAVEHFAVSGDMVGVELEVGSEHHKERVATGEGPIRAVRAQVARSEDIGFITHAVDQISCGEMLSSAERDHRSATSPVCDLVVHPLDQPGCLPNGGRSAAYDGYGPDDLDNSTDPTGSPASRHFKVRPVSCSISATASAVSESNNSR